MEYMPTLTPLAPPQLIGIYGIVPWSVWGMEMIEPFGNTSDMSFGAWELGDPFFSPGPTERGPSFFALNGCVVRERQHPGLTSPH